MRTLFLLMLLVNLGALGYIQYAESRAGGDQQFTLLQINPEKLKLLTLARGNTAAAQQPLPGARSGLVCLEWGGVAAADAERAAAALVRLGLGDRVSQRDSGEGGFWVYVPPLNTRAEADRKVAELKALGVADFYVMQDNNPLRFAISLGVFRTEEAANGYLAQLRRKGVRPLAAGPRGAKASVFVIRDPGDAMAGKIAGLAADFPGTQLKATTCADALTNR